MTSRVSDASMQSVALRHLRNNLSAVEEARERVSSGMRIRKPSDDPEGATTVMRLESRLRGVEQRRANIRAGRRRLSTEEGVLSQLTDILSRARELGTREASDTANSETRQQTQNEIDSLIESVKSLGNTKLNDSYLFGGDYADQAPIEPDGTMSPDTPSGTHRVKVGEGRTVRTNHDAQEIFFDSGMMSSMQDLSAALGSNDREDIAAAASDVDDAFGDIQELLGEVGARMNELESAGKTLESLESNLTESRAETEEVALEKAVTELASRQTALQSAMYAISETQNTSLLQFLR
ncbi:MAG: flagellar hook-associated protein FlgL [Candidatus Palauibacterales bacterium]|nr:flagellar hook-associated protein FlgL [Candidatus Palauibacterales bacterium]